MNFKPKKLNKNFYLIIKMYFNYFSVNTYNFLQNGQLNKIELRR